jgi:hypothetical protein
VHVSVACPSFFKSNLMGSFRSAKERQRTMASNFFGRSRSTATEVAAAALDGLEAGRLFVVPHREGRFAWRMKRLNPGLYFAALRALLYTFGLERRLLK